MVAENKAGPELFEHNVADREDFFYVNDGLIYSTKPVWIQWEFDFLIGIFERVILDTNVDKMVATVCQPRPISGK